MASGCQGRGKKVNRLVVMPAGAVGPAWIEQPHVTQSIGTDVGGRLRGLSASTGAFGGTSPPGDVGGRSAPDSWRGAAGTRPPFGEVGAGFAYGSPSRGAPPG